MNKPDCPNCPHNHFCCTFKVRLTPLDTLKIRLKGHKKRDFLEKDSQGNKTIKLVNNHCYFLKNNSCQIYPVRPAPCKKFPFLYPKIKSCQDLYLPWQKHQQKIRKLLK